MIHGNNLSHSCFSKELRNWCTSAKLTDELTQLVDSPMHSKEGLGYTIEIYIG
jgi:hypothetical protein